MKRKDYESLKEIYHVPSIHLIAKWSCLFFILLAVIFAILPWQQTAFGEGRVIAYSPTERQQTIAAPVDGRLGKWYVYEGSQVKKGQPIVDIFDNDPNIIQKIQLEKIATEKSLAVAENAATIAKSNLDRQYNLYKQGISARKTYEMANLEYAKYINNVESLKVELARVDVKLSRQHTQRVIAPMDGSILKRNTGQESVFVKAGEVIAELVPTTNSRAVELWIDGNDVPLVNVGDEVRLQFEGWPSIQFSGWPSVAVGTFGALVSVVDAAADTQGRFRLLVTPGKDDHWPEARYLRQGIRAHGWVLLGRVKLWFELWRRFNGFPPSQSQHV